MAATIEVKWGKRRFQVDYEPDMTVKDLKAKCERVTGLHTMKLLAYGAVMKDESQPLSTYGLRPGAKVMLLASHPTAEKKEEGNPVLELVQGATNKLAQQIAPDVDQYEQRVLDAPQDPKARQKLTEYGIYLNEQLMNILFELDGILCGQDEKARHQRKAGVQTAQALLERVDSIKAQLKRM
ncbi:hypothetical protein BCR43DRAFT_349296 [Syncephalastrum racemosum]|uniref:BAG domain-domain-containing protein n=1 Tax=Syncephalastrum racemosum TaxID=13706 RepID=A0A1X2H5Z1_SYNRA|nr:hypothetical protein BCR43DRAFT_349296 [Syncephalastrum racemosum]